jgi:hypothetical protein
MQRVCRMHRMHHMRFRSRVSRMSLIQLTGRLRTGFTGYRRHKRQLNTYRRCKTAVEIAPPSNQLLGATALDPIGKSLRQR